MENTRILVVDDDANICELINLYLSNEGYQLFFCHDGSSALDRIKAEKFDLILLDVMLPIINGWEVCRLIRQQSQVPIIFLTARDMIEDKVQGFELGADDYLVKPFEPRELVARVKIRLKGKNNNDKTPDGIVRVGNLSVDIRSYEVKVNERTVDLKPKEIQLLHFLLLNKNIVFSREMLLEKVWDYNFEGDTRTVDVHINRLREKVEDGSNTYKIKTVWGVGYKLEVI
ncbi:MAG: response regulator transcription factor [Oscillospiraceae bacterium]